MNTARVSLFVLLATGALSIVALATGALSNGVAIAASPQPAAPATRTDGPIHQLRIYEIFENNKQAFHDRFRDHAMRIMKRYDFHIVAMWETRSGERTEFAYLLQWPDRATMQDRWTKFMANQEWSDIKKATRVHGQMVGEIQDRTLLPTRYSPKVELLD